MGRRKAHLPVISHGGQSSLHRSARGHGAPDVDGLVGARKALCPLLREGGTLVNCVCVVEKTGWEVESWTEPGDLQEMKADFSGWHGDIQTLIEAADQNSLYKWALFDRRRCHLGDKVE